MTSRATERLPTALVTGSAAGIGMATAIALAAHGHRVMATVRDPTRATALRQAVADAGHDLEILTLDVTDDRSVTSCIDDVVARHGAIDVVVNNAGVGCSGTLEELSIDDLRRSIEVNYLGVARVTKAVLPHMRAAGEGRIIAVSSIAGAFGQPFNDAYSAAKFALEGLYEALWPVAAAFGISVSLVQAGPVAGGFVDHAGGIKERAADDPFAPLWDRFDRVAQRSFARAQTPEAVAEVIAGVATEASPRLRYQTSDGIRRAVEVKLSDVTGERVSAMTGAWLT